MFFRIDLCAGNYGNGVETLRSVLYAEMRSEAEKYGVTLDRADQPAGQFKYLIEKASQHVGEKAVVIIYDEKYMCFMLDYPNIEARASLAYTLIKHYLKIPSNRVLELREKLVETLCDEDVDGTMKVIKLFFAEIPYNHIT
jgi:hypothetical protein